MKLIQICILKLYFKTIFDSSCSAFVENFDDKKIILIGQELAEVILNKKVTFMCGNWKYLNTWYFAAGLWFSPGVPVSSTNKNDRHTYDIHVTDILLKVVLDTMTLLHEYPVLLFTFYKCKYRSNVHCGYTVLTMCFC